MNLKIFLLFIIWSDFPGYNSALEMGENSAIINSNGGYIQLGKKLNLIQNVYIYCRLKQDLFL